MKHVQISRMYQVIVEDYGATGGGTGNDTVAIQAAIDAAGGKVVVLRNTVYNISSRLTLPVGTYVEGNGAVLKILNDFPQQLVGGNDIRPAVLMNTRCRVRGVKVDGNHKVCDGFAGAFTDDWMVDTCEAYHYNSQFGMADIACNRITYSNSRVYESPKFGIHSYKSNGCMVLNNYVDTTTSGFYSGWSKNLLVRGNVLKNCSDVQLDFEGGYNCISDDNIVESFQLGGLTIYSGNGEDTYTPSHLIHRNNTVRQTATYKKYTITSGVGSTTDVGVAAEVGGCQIYSYADGQHTCGFENNTIYVDANAGPAFRTNQRVTKGGSSAFFSKNKVYSADKFFDCLDFEGLVLEGNYFRGLPGSETKQNNWREQSNGRLDNNTFDYVNTKTTNYAVNINTQTGYATVPAYVSNNKFVNTDDWAMQADLFQRNAGFNAELSNNQLTNYYRPKGGLNVTANGNIVVRNQSFQIMLPEGATDVLNIPALGRTGPNKCSGDLTYGKSDYMGWAGMFYYMRSSSVIITKLLDGFGLNVGVSTTTVTLSNTNGLVGGQGRLDVTVNSF